MMDTQSRYLVFPPSFGEPLLSIGFPTDSDRPYFLPGDPSSATTSHIRKISQDRRKKRQNLNVRGQGESFRQATTIGLLPDNVLLEIFDFYRKNHLRFIHFLWEWDLLVQVCRRWRQIVFASPHRLNLRIVCGPITPVRKNLDIWPAFPIVINCLNTVTPGDEDNVIAALEHHDRVDCVELSGTSSQLGKMVTAMQEPFPVLTNLHIESKDCDVPALPTEFLGGSAPCLQEIYLRGIPFPALPTLLLSTSDLVTLQVHNIPPTGYISPEALVGSLAALPRLKNFTIGFRLATPHPDRTRRPLTRTVLPALIDFEFRGASEYLEDLVARIDAPQLNGIRIYFLNQLIDFQVAQLSKFVDRSVGPKLIPSRNMCVTFYRDRVAFNTYSDVNHPFERNLHPATTVILCEGIDWQVSHMAQVLSQFSATLSNIVRLELKTDYHFPKEYFQSEGTDIEWVHLLRQVSTVHALHISRDLAGYVARALEDIVGEMMVAEVLPFLDLINLGGRSASNVEKFVAARRLIDRPVTVVDTQWPFQRVESYDSE